MTSADWCSYGGLRDKTSMGMTGFLRCVLVVFALCSCALQTRAGELQVGVAATNITPPRGAPMAGYYRERAADGVLDEIFSKAIVIEQDGAKAAFVSLDIITTTRPITLAARKLIAEQTGIPEDRVMISATHSHTGPVLKRDSIMDDLTGGKTPPALAYTDGLPALIARSVFDANARLAPAKAFATVGREEGLSFNRRFWLQDGTVGWNMPKLDKRIVRPAGPIDPDVGVLYLETAAKNPSPLATYVNFAMHPDVVGGTKISADYPYYLAKRLSEYKGDKMMTFFANGCCGNLNQRNVAWADPQKGKEEAERIGTVLASAVFKSWASLQRLQSYPPRARSTLVSLPLPKFSDAEAEAARAVALRMSDPKIGTVPKAKAFCTLDVLAREGKPLDVEVQAIAFSDDLAIVSLPGEIFVELGLAIKKDSPFKHTFIAELANGSIGYIPNRSAYPEGNYEVVSARCAEGSGEMLVEAALKLLKELRNP